MWSVQVTEYTVIATARLGCDLPICSGELTEIKEKKEKIKSNNTEDKPLR
jgi:hypothetical protein